jgi:myo-inositol-1(or 4)-monophosphatase
MDLNQICQAHEFSIEIAVMNEIINKIKSTFQNVETNNINILEKGEKDGTTLIDLMMEKEIISIIQKYFPDDIILSEETLANEKIRARSWVIDPIDGTFNFANNIPTYGVQVAFVNEGITRIASVYHPKTDEHFFALKGIGSFLNEVKITSKKETSTQDMIVTIGDFSPVDHHINDLNMKIIHTIKNEVLRIRLFGASCIDFCYYAAGRTSGHIMCCSKPWDIIPGILIAEEAGAFVSALDGKELNVENGSGLIVSNSESFNKYVISAINNE